MDSSYDRDWGGNIRVIRDRLSRGEDPTIWRPYLEILLEARAKEEAEEAWHYAQNEPPGLSGEVYKRLYIFKSVPPEPREAVSEQAKVNLRAVMEAYRSGELEVRPGLVTYWIGGQRVSDYVEKKDDEINRLVSEARARGESLWIEDPILDEMC